LISGLWENHEELEAGVRDRQGREAGDIAARAGARRSVRAPALCGPQHLQPVAGASAAASAAESPPSSTIVAASSSRIRRSPVWITARRYWASLTTSEGWFMFWLETRRTSLTASTTSPPTSSS